MQGGIDNLQTEHKGHGSIPSKCPSLLLPVMESRNDEADYTVVAGVRSQPNTTSGKDNLL